MELDHEFTVPVPVDTAWAVLLDVERVGPCMPGATVDSFDGETITGRLKVRLGAMTITYRGTARIVARDEQARTATVEGTGKEARGSGTATATVRATLRGEGARTRVVVHTKLNVTGRPAQFGRNLLSEVGEKLVKRFATNLAAELSHGAESEPAGARPRPSDASHEAPDKEPAEAPSDAPPATAHAVPPTPYGPRPAHGAVHPVRGPVERPPIMRDAPQGRGGSGHALDDGDAIDLLGVAGPSIAKRAAPVLAGAVLLLTVRWLLRRRRRRRADDPRARQPSPLTDRHYS